MSSECTRFEPRGSRRTHLRDRDIAGGERVGRGTRSSPGNLTGGVGWLFQRGYDPRTWVSDPDREPTTAAAHWARTLLESVLVRREQVAGIRRRVRRERLRAHRESAGSSESQGRVRRITLVSLAGISAILVGHFSLRTSSQHVAVRSPGLHDPTTTHVEVKPGARPAPDTPAVGALFVSSRFELSRHFCSASVVSSPGGDLILTAAHCVTPFRRDLVFVPGYRDGKAPFGVWEVERVFVDEYWRRWRSPSDDFAFLIVHSRRRGSDLERLTGAERVGDDEHSKSVVTVTGYPDGSSTPITCTNRTRRFAPTQLEFDCGGYTDGTSGSPFLTSIDPRNGLGTVVGVVGGYQQGGDTPQVSYASVFGQRLAMLYARARRASLGVF